MRFSWVWGSTLKKTKQSTKRYDKQLAPLFFLFQLIEFEQNLTMNQIKKQKQKKTQDSLSSIP